MRFKAYIAIVIILLSVFASCRKDLHDDEKPVAEIINPTGGTYTTTIPFQLSFTDNKNLAQYRLALTYTGTYDSNDSAVVHPFNLVWVDAISNSVDSKLLNITIPDTALSGPYRAILTCVDETGLESARDTALFTIKNTIDTISPGVTVTSPLSGSSYTDSIYVSAAIFDPSKVVYYLIELKDNAGAIKSQLNKYINVDSYPIDEVIYTTGLSAGNYTLFITVRDAYYNTHTESIPIILNQ